MSNLAQIQAASRVARQATLRSVSLQDLKVSMGIRAEEVGLNRHELRFDTKVRIRRIDNSSAEAFVSIDVRTRKKTETDPWGSIIATMRLIYNDLDGVDDKSLAAFGRLNGEFNAWPFLRELVQNLCTRMAIPPIVLPLLRPKSPIPMTENKSPSSKRLKSRGAASLVRRTK